MSSAANARGHRAPRLAGRRGVYLPGTRRRVPSLSVPSPLVRLTPERALLLDLTDFVQDVIIRVQLDDI